MYGYFGMQAAATGSSYDLYVEDQSMDEEDSYHARFLFDPNSAEASGEEADQSLLTLYGLDESQVAWVKLYISEGEYQVYAGIMDEGENPLETDYYEIGDGPHTIDIEWYAMSGEEANDGNNTISSSSTQNADLQRSVQRLKLIEEINDIRANQEQVNASGIRIGINKPDLQFTYWSERYYIEWDTPNSSRGIPHAQRI